MSTLPGHVKLCMVVGNPVQFSLSPLMHNAAYWATGLQDDFFFTAACIEHDRVEAVLGGCAALGVRGISVTQPFKEAVIPFMDEIDEDARRIGCINTIVFENGKCLGSNTDWRGIVDPLQERCSLKDQSCLVIGAGGAARAAVYGLSRAGARVQIMNRTESKAKVLAEEFSATTVAFEDKNAIQNASVIVQTTSVGLGTLDVSPIDGSLLHEGQLVFDAIYNPLQTKLLLDALQHGAQIIEGIEMFVAQGAAQFSLYTESKPPIDAMKKAVREFLEEANN